MSKILTAEEFLINQGCIQNIEDFFNDVQPIDLIEFTKLHVKAALEAASENAVIVCKKGADHDCKACYGGGCEEPMIDKDSILNSFSLENIK